MRVKVSEVAEQATTGQAGLRLHALIEPALARGETVVLDFEGIRYFAAPFFSSSIGLLIEEDAAKRLPDLLRCENLPENGQIALDLATDHAVRRRDIPGWGAAMDDSVRKWSERD